MAARARICWRLGALVNQARQLPPGRLHFLQISKAMLGDPRRRPAVAKRQAGPRHCPKQPPVPAQSHRPPATIRSGSVPTSSIDSDDQPLRPLRLVAKDQQRHAQRRRFLLHSAGIAQHQVGARASPRSLRHGTAEGSAKFRACRPTGDASVRSPWDWAEGCTSAVRPDVRQARAMPSPAPRDRPPQFSRRWQVTSSLKCRRGHQRRRGLTARARPARPAHRCRCCR